MLSVALSMSVMCVCLSVRMSGKPCVHTTKFSVHVACGRMARSMSMSNVNFIGLAHSHAASIALSTLVD